ncbi:MAG: UPF0182 family protein, partial [Acidobacteriaceae bacterium]
MDQTIDFRKPAPRSRRLLLLLIALILLFFFGASTLLSWYVDSNWFDSLGYRSVFWKGLELGWVAFAVFFAATFLLLYGWFMALWRMHQPDLPHDRSFFVGRQQLSLPLRRALRWIGLLVSLVIALISGAAMMAEWPTFALLRAAPPAAHPVLDPVFGKPLNFYLFTLPAWQLVIGWLLGMAILACVGAAGFLLLAASSHAISRGRDTITPPLPWRGASIALSFLLLVIAAQVYLSRFTTLLDTHTIFSGVNYTEAHVTIAGLLIIAIALVLGAVIALTNLSRWPRPSRLVAAVIPAVVVWFGMQAVAWYVSSFIVKPNQLDRERPYIAWNIAWTRAAWDLDRVSTEEFPADPTVQAADAPDNQPTLQNIRLWDWRALQDTLRQIQEIRTYYDFPDIDIDRYTLDGQMREVMLAARELNVDKLPDSSRNWINEKLIYTHGYGVTMNPVNGFTREGLPTLYLSNMPVESTVPGLAVTRPEIYFGELTNTDVYVDTH